MSLAEALANKKNRLAKVETEADDSLLKRPAIATDDTSYQNLMKETYFEEYWDVLKPFTFGSELVPLTQEAAKEIGKYHQMFLNKEDSTIWQKESKELIELSKKVEQSSKQYIKEDDPCKDGFFVRFSSRSPKDAALAKDSFNTLLQQQLQITKEEEANEEILAKKAGDNIMQTSETNQKLHALYRAGTIALKVTNGIEAIQMFIESPRVQDDLQVYANADDNPEFNVVVREWGDFDVQLEFRAFIWKKKFTALTQYCDFIIFPKMARRVKEIESACRKFIDENIKPIIALDSYVLDIAMKYPTNDSDDYKCYVVEVNPLAEFSGMGLFEWVKDWKIITGEQEFQFRFVEKEDPLAVKKIAGNWFIEGFFDE